MRLLAVRIVLAVIANAIALIVAAALLDGVHIDASGFLLALVIFTIGSLILTPLVTWVVIRRMRALIGVVGLVATFVVLLVTDLLSDGFTINGTVDWILAVLIVWVVNLVFEVAAGPLRRRGVRMLGGAPGPG
jgi:putative membrane protein